MTIIVAADVGPFTGCIPEWEMGVATFRGVIFDFNGVLWWDRELQEQAWQQFTLRHRGQALSIDEMVQHILGRDNRYSLHYILGPDMTAREVEDATEEKESLYRELCIQSGPQFRLSPGTEALLDDFVRRNIPRAIATSSERRNVEFFIEGFDLHRWFEPGTIVHTDGTIHGKPAPDLYLLAAQRIDCSPRSCVVVEDSISGIEAAKQAGIGYLVALGTPERHGILRRHAGVNLVIPNLTEFPRDLLM